MYSLRLLAKAPARLFAMALLVFAPRASAQVPEGVAPAAAAETGTIQLVLFGPGDRALGDVQVEAGAQTQATNSDGASYLSMPEGTHRLRLAVPRAYLPEVPIGQDYWTVDLPDIPAVAGETTQVIVTLGASGAVLGLDVQAPEAGGGARSLAREFQKALESKPKGTVRGTVVAVEGGAPIAGARVYVRGAPVEAETSGEGVFTLELPEGSYQFSIIHPKFSTESVPEVGVVAGQTKELRAELSPASVELEELVVTAPHIEGSIASVLNERRESGAVRDAIAAEDISRTPAGDAAGAAQRIVGVNVVGGRFVYVRGLGERYTNALLNNSLLPSPEPDRATVPLDLFPSQIISSIDIAKTFSPDMPADFAGGSVRIETVAVPERLVLAASITTGFNSLVTFKDRLSYKGGARDWLGIDDGSRSLPREVPRDHALVARSPEAVAAAPALNSSLSVGREQTPPNIGFGFALGNGWKFRKQRRLGALVALSYSHKYSLQSQYRRTFAGATAGVPNLWQQAKVEVANDPVRWGAFGTLAYEFSKQHRLRFLGFRSQLSDDEVVVSNGYNVNGDYDFVNSRQQFASRSLDVGQLRGEHEFKRLGGAQLDWRLSLSRAERDQPDTRSVTYNFSETRGDWVWHNDVESGRHFFSGQNEQARNGALDWTQPFKVLGLDQKIKFGGLFLTKDRSFRARRFRYRESTPRPPIERLACGVNYDPDLCPRILFTDENVSGPVFTLEEGTLLPDAYRADLDIYAGYLMADLSLAKWLRFVAGSRLESTNQRIAVVEQFSGMEPDGEVKLNALDALPSAALIFTATDKLQVRVSGSRTLARPQLRELAKFAFTDYFGGAEVTGNPNLKLTHILNGDLRVEYFPIPREVLAASVFIKDFSDPIEPILRAGTSNPVVTYQNAKGARLYGFELEARQGLDIIAAFLAPLTLIGNITIARSDVRVRPEAAIELESGQQPQYLTNLRRAMVNQAPYVVNLMLDYENSWGTQLRLLYNISGAQIVQVGTDGLEDAYLHPRHSLDFTASQKLWAGLQLRLTLQNLTNPEYLVTQGKKKDRDRATVSYHEGISGSIGVGYAY